MVGMGDYQDRPVPSSPMMTILQQNLGDFESNKGFASARRALGNGKFIINKIKFVGSTKFEGVVGMVKNMHYRHGHIPTCCQQSRGLMNHKNCGKVFEKIMRLKLIL